MMANLHARPLDTLLSFHMDTSPSAKVPVRYAVRQVLDQELKKEKLLQNSLARHARSGGSEYRVGADGEDKENESPVNKAKQAISKDPGTKRDFFGNIINDSRPNPASKSTTMHLETKEMADAGRIWVSFHEGFSNAVRKPITLKELLDGF